MQSRKQSLFESTVNIIVGFMVAFLSGGIIFPLFGIHITVMDNFWITVWFTFVSFLRSYFLRRWFNHRSTIRIPPGKKKYWGLTEGDWKSNVKVDGHGPRPEGKPHAQGARLR